MALFVLQINTSSDNPQEVPFLVIDLPLQCSFLLSHRHSFPVLQQILQDPAVESPDVL